MDGALIDWHPVAVATVLMALDVATGFAGAAKNKALESGKMREGAWHKAGFFGLIGLAAVWEAGSLWLGSEVSGLGIAVPDLPAVGAVCTFVVATEIVSVLENLCALNPDIASLPVVKRLKPHEQEEQGSPDDWETVIIEKK